MAPGRFGQLLQRVLTPSALLQAGIVSLVALVILTSLGASSGRLLEPRHWFGLWVAGFAVMIIGTALIQLPLMLRDQRHDGQSSEC